MPCPHHIHYNLYQYLSELNAPSFSLHPSPSTSSPHTLAAIKRWRLTPPLASPPPSLCLCLPSPPLTSTSKSFTLFIVRCSSGRMLSDRLDGVWRLARTQLDDDFKSPVVTQKEKKRRDRMTSFQAGWAHYSLCCSLHYRPCKGEGIKRDLLFYFFWCVKLLEGKDSLQFLASGGEVGDINQAVSDTYGVHYWLARLTFGQIWRDVLVQVF